MGYPLLHLDLALAPPGKMTWPTIVGGIASGGTSMSGVSSSVDVTGSGFVTVKYSQMALGNSGPAKLRYVSRLAAALNGGVRPIIVPLMTDVTAPTPGDAGNFKDTTFSDGSRFSDATDFTANAPTSELDATAGVNAGTLALRMGSGLALVGGEWFSILHTSRSYRAYCVTDVDGAVANNDGTVTYTVGIRPTLREATNQYATINFARPLCVMRLRQGTMIDVDVDVGMLASPEISFEEFFGATS